MRREFEEFNALYPDFKKKQTIIDRLIIFINIIRIERLFEKTKSRSQEWHEYQQKLSLLSSSDRDMLIRSRFYELSVLKCGTDPYILPGVIICYPYRVSLGNKVFINRNVYITAREKIVIGDNTMIGPHCIINSGMHKYKDRNVPIRDQGHTKEPIIIGKDVWIGANVTILPGVTIGDGSIIGAGAVVTHSIPEYSVAVGVPARVIKQR